MASPIGVLQEKPSIAKILDFLKRSPGAPGKKKIMPVLEEKPERIGLLLSERLLNLPLELVPTLFRSLLDDITWARENAVRPVQGPSEPVVLCFTVTALFCGCRSFKRRRTPWMWITC